MLYPNTFLIKNQMMKTVYLMLMILFISAMSSVSQEVNAQDFSEDYELLQSQAPIPKSILTTAYSKSLRDIRRQVDSRDDKREQKAKSDFIKQTNYVLDQLMQSHLLLFNTPLNRLMETIADDLLKDDPAFREKLNFHVVKSSSVNAFATDRGDIFVTIGLLARMETEAELAFVLAHEIVHVQEQHSMELFDANLELENNQRRFNKKTVDLLLRKSNYSKEAEFEADEGGLAMLAKTKYNLKSANEVFHTLEIGHTTVRNDSISKEMFEF